MTRALQNGESQRSTCNSDDIVVDSHQHKRVGLAETLAGHNVGGTVGDRQGTSASGTGLGLGGGGELDTDVGQFAKVGGAVGVDIQQVQGVGVQVVASLLGDGGGTVPGLDKGEVVDGHVRETLGVLVVDRHLGQGIRGSRGVERHTSGGGHSRGGRVVGPIGFVGGVLESKEQGLDRVGEVDVDAGGVAGAVNRLRVVGLDLLDEQIAGGLAHQLALVVGHQGVLGPDLDVRQGDVRVGQVRLGGIGGDTTRASTARDGSDVVDNQQVGPVTEVEAQLHLVVRQSGGGESNTSVACVAVGEGQHQGGGGDGQTIVGGTDGVRVVVQQRDVANHVLVADALGRGDGEGRPEVQEVVIETHLDQVIEGDGGLLQQVVHQVAGPTNAGVGTETSGGGIDGDRGEGHAQPVEQEVITSTGDVGVPLHTKLRGLVEGQCRGDNGEPSRFGHTANKVRDGFSAAIHVLLGFVVRGKIDKAGCERIG